MNETDTVPALREPTVQKGRETIKQATLVRNSEWLDEGMSGWSGIS